MPPFVAQLIGWLTICLALHSDKRRDPGSIPGVFWPSLWYLVVASRPVGVWFNLWGVPLGGGGGGGDATDGSSIDRNFFLLLTLIGFATLARRQFNWGAAFRANPWITALIVYMAISITWSDYSYVSFKRYVKVLGSMTMALVVLTNERPLDSIFTVIRRTLYVHLPMSIVCIRYYRQIGINFDWSGTGVTWCGISTSKNTLGQIAMLGAIYFTWEVWRHWKEHKWKSLHFVYLLMALYLLKGADDSVSMTSVSVSIFAMVIFFRLQSLRENPRLGRRFVTQVTSATLLLITLIVAHSLIMFSEDSVFGYLVTKFGRDITLTDRTYIWHDVYQAASRNPLLGVGYGGFWIGRLANIPWNASMTWELGQAHSGYIDTYLQLGLIGVFILAGMLITKIFKFIGALDEAFDFTCFRITMIITIMFVNVTETAFLRGDHHLWFILQLCVWMVPSAIPSVKPMVNGGLTPPQTSGAEGQAVPA
jgi:exopolysaccharide production protein ExoQ